MPSISPVPNGHFKILYFAAASSYVGKEYEYLPAPLPLQRLFAELESRYPGFRAKILASCFVTINLEYVDVPVRNDSDIIEIREGDEVAIIPPVSSG